MKKDKADKRIQRKKRVRGKVEGNNERPRLNVFRSNKHVFAQIIDDVKGKTLVSMSDLEIKKSTKKISKKDEGENSKKDLANMVGQELAKKAITKKIKKVVFDKGGYKYHGRVKEVAEGARKGGLEF